MIVKYCVQFRYTVKKFCCNRESARLVSTISIHMVFDLRQKGRSLGVKKGFCQSIEDTVQRKGRRVRPGQNSSTIIVAVHCVVVLIIVIVKSTYY